MSFAPDRTGIPAVSGTLTSRTLTPAGIVYINDLRPRTPSGALVFAGAVNGAVFDIYAQAAPNNMYTLIALASGTSVAGRTDVLKIGTVIDQPALGLIEWLPPAGGALDTAITIASDGIHLHPNTSSGSTVVVFESPARTADLTVSTPNSGSTIAAAQGLTLSGVGGITISGGGVVIQPTASNGIVFFPASGITLNPGTGHGGDGVTTTFDQFGHLVAAQGLPPTVVVGAAAGVGATASFSAQSTDQEGVLIVTSGTSPGGANQVLATVTFRSGLANLPHRILITPANVWAANLARGVDPYVDTDTDVAVGSWILRSGLTALGTSTTYKWWYSVK